MASVEPANEEGVRLAELVAALSLGIDLGFGQPMEHVLRQCMIALRLAAHADLDDDGRATVYYTALLVNVGCHADAHEQAKWFGDDIELKSNKHAHEFGSVAGALSTLRMVGSGNSPLHRFRVGLEFAVSGHRAFDGMIERHSELARGLAVRLGLPEQTQRAIGAAYEQWDGKGWPGLARGEQVPLAARLAQIAEFTEVAHRVGGVDAAVALVNRRAGSQFDPALAATFTAHAHEILDGLHDAHTFDAVIAAEPGLGVRLAGSAFDEALLAVADFVDLKSPYTLGHSRAVAALVARAAEILGWEGARVETLRRAGLVHDLGRLGVSNAIWDKPGPLGVGERERVRLCPYLTERMLEQSETLAPLGAIAVAHHERLDGSGYPRGIAGSAISLEARLLGAADTYEAMREPRPYRPALATEAAAAVLRSEVAAGRLDADVVDAVLLAAGHRVTRRREGPSGLTTREVEVLQLLALGLSSKEIAARLVISPKTARNHVEHIYAKISVSSRVQASLYATEHGLVPASATG